MNTPPEYSIGLRAQNRYSSLGRAKRRHNNEEALGPAVIKSRKASVASPQGEAIKKLCGRTGGRDPANARFRYSVAEDNIRDRSAEFEN